MTPLEKAQAAYLDHKGFSPSVDAAVEAACLAYVAALAGDENTVEAVARALDPQAYRDKGEWALAKAQKAARRSTARKKAKGILASLTASRGDGKP